MKKSNYLTLFLLSVMMLAVISCSKKEEETPVATPLSSSFERSGNEDDFLPLPPVCNWWVKHPSGSALLYARLTFIDC